MSHVGRGLFYVLLTLATLVRIIALPMSGQEDMRAWGVWTYGAAQDVTGVYGVGGDPPIRGVIKFGDTPSTVDYPPLALYELAIAGKIYRTLDPTFADDWHLRVAVKAPGLLFGAVLTWVLYSTVYRFTGRIDHARLAALAYWLNPATILNGEVLGYLDPLAMLPAVGSLVLLHRRLPVAAGAVLAMALLTKPQGVLVGPAFVLAAWHTGRWRALVRSGATCLVAVAIGILPFVLRGAFPNMILAFGSWAGRRDILSGNAANFWWIVTWLARAWNMIPEYGVPGAYLQPVRRILAISSYMTLGLPNPRPFGMAMVAAACAWAWWRTRRARDLGVHAALAAFTVHAFFVLGVSVHDNHMMLAVPLLVLAAALRPAFVPVAVAVSLICALNMNLFYGMGRGWGWAFPRRAIPPDASVWLAFINVATLVWHGRVLAREAGESPPGAPPTLQ
jgi:dolichyl-phosphate-mannose-protein mannosyltransferase